MCEPPPLGASAFLSHPVRAEWRIWLLDKFNDILMDLVTWQQLRVISQKSLHTYVVLCSMLCNLPQFGVICDNKLKVVIYIFVTMTLCNLSF